MELNFRPINFGETVQVFYFRNKYFIRFIWRMEENSQSLSEYHFAYE